jgi:hypothetical protein
MKIVLDSVGSTLHPAIKEEGIAAILGDAAGFEHDVGSVEPIGIFVVEKLCPAKERHSVNPNHVGGVIELHEFFVEESRDATVDIDQGQGMRPRPLVGQPASKCLVHVGVGETVHLNAEDVHFLIHDEKPLCWVMILKIGLEG